MKLTKIGLPAALAIGLAGAAFAMDETEEIVDSEQPARASRRARSRPQHPIRQLTEAR